MIQVEPVLKARLESEGFRFEERQENHKRFTYLIYPSGQSYKFFQHLTQIMPGDVYDGEEFDLAETALPSDVRYIGISVNNYEYLPSTMQPAQYVKQNGQLYVFDPETNQLVMPWYALVIIVAIVALVIIGVMHMLTSIVQKVNAPCGIDATQIEINECWKMVIAPDCSYRLFNACAGEDTTGDGYPDGEWYGDWRKDIWDPTGMIKWAVIGVVAIAGVYVIIKLFTRPKQPAAAPAAPAPAAPAYKEAPGIDYIGE